MRINPDNIHQCSSAEVDRRETEIRILLNVIQPNPAWQPLLITDETTLDDMTDLDPAWYKHGWCFISASRCQFPFLCGSGNSWMR